MTWFRPIDPTGGALGTGSRYSARTGGPRTVVPPAAPAAPADPPPVVEPAPAAGLGMGGFAHDPAAPLAPGKVLEYSWPAEAAEKPRRISLPARARASLHPETVRGRILIAAALVCEGKLTRPASNADVIVRAWREWPEVFGLAGYSLAHPDSNRVLAKLAGRGGLVEEGWLSRPSAGELLLTHRGAWWWREVGKPWLAEQKEKR